MNKNIEIDYEINYRFEFINIWC